MTRAEEVDRIQRKYRMLDPVLNERTRRIWAATEARAIGYGGLSRVAEATGLSRPRILRGLSELKQQETTGQVLDAGRIRRPGGGDQRLAQKDPTLVPDLDALVDPATRGDPMSPLRWTC
jgi:DNA-binding phage protein